MPCSLDTSFLFLAKGISPFQGLSTDDMKGIWDFVFLQKRQILILFFVKLCIQVKLPATLLLICTGAETHIASVRIIVLNTGSVSHRTYEDRGKFSNEMMSRIVAPAHSRLTSCSVLIKKTV